MKKTIDEVRDWLLENGFDVGSKIYRSSHEAEVKSWLLDKEYDSYDYTCYQVELDDYEIEKEYNEKNNR
mgnify:CR=1 FL=1